MQRKTYDPLAFVPSPDAVREKLFQTETLAERLRILLDLSERLQLSLVTASQLPTAEQAKGAARG
jgi:hypothetical protein